MNESIKDEEWVMVVATHPPPLVGYGSPVVQCLTMRGFRLVAVAVTDASACQWGDRLYVGPGSWDRVEAIEHRLSYEWLTPAVQEILRPTVAAIIRHDESRFIEAFNTTILDDLDAHPLTLLTALAPDCREAIRAERATQRFADFADLTARVACCERPQAVVADRVLAELQADEEGYRWLTS